MSSNPAIQERYQHLKQKLRNSEVCIYESKTRQVNLRKVIRETEQLIKDLGKSGHERTDARSHF